MDDEQLVGKATELHHNEATSYAWGCTVPLHTTTATEKHIGVCSEHVSACQINSCRPPEGSFMALLLSTSLASGSGTAVGDDGGGGVAAYRVDDNGGGVATGGAVFDGGFVVASGDSDSGVEFGGDSDSGVEYGGDGDSGGAADSGGSVDNDSGHDLSESDSESFINDYEEALVEAAEKMLRQTPKNSVDLLILHRRRARYRRLRLLSRVVACTLAIERRTQEKETLRTHIPSVRFNINSLSDKECLDRFRFRKVHLGILLWKFQLPAFFSTLEGYRSSAIEGLCITLERLSYPSRWFDLRIKYGRSESNLSSVFYYVCEWIARRCAPLLKGDWDRISLRLEDFASAIHAKGGELRNVWGFIDGTVRPICRPGDSLEQRAMYSGHKRTHAVKYQSVTTPDGMIAHLFGPAEGRSHDLTLLDASGLEETIKNDHRFAGYLIYGDPAYGQSDVFASPFDRIGATREQSAVNASMSSVRITVEWGFGQIISEWAMLDFKKKMTIGNVPVGTLYEVATILTNCVTIARHQNVISSYFDVAPPDFQEYFACIVN